MKNILFVVFISMIFLFVCCNTTTNKNIIETEISDFDKILDSFQVNGSILIYDNDKNTFYSNDFDWAKNGKLPASTFKIPNSIIAVELGIIENDTTILKWNGEQRKMDIWEKDLSFKDAFRILLAVVQTEEIQQRVEHLPHTLGRLPDIIHIHGAFIRATTFLHQSGIASFCQSYFFVVEVVYDDRFAFFRASVWQIVYTIREALLLGVI